MMLTIADNGKSVALKIGESLAITLDSNPSDGRRRCWGNGSNLDHRRLAYPLKVTRLA